MKLTLAVLSVALLVGVKASPYESNPFVLRCLEGPSFWCSSERNAELCGMTVHCNREWKKNLKTVLTSQVHETVPDLDGAYCKTCLSIANNLKQFIDTGIPKQALDNKMKSVCHNMQDAVDPENCISSLDLVVNDIFHNFEAQTVCASLDLCQSEPADIVENFNGMHATKLHAKIKSVLMFIEVEDTDPKDECQECVKTISDAEEQLPNHYSLQEFTELLQAECDRLDASVKEQCYEYAAKLAQMIYSKADPKSVCQFLGKC